MRGQEMGALRRRCLGRRMRSSPMRGQETADEPLVEAIDGEIEPHEGSGADPMVMALDVTDPRSSPMRGQEILLRRPVVTAGKRDRAP